MHPYRRLLALLLTLTAGVAAAAPLQQRLHVELRPEAAELAASAVVTLPPVPTATTHEFELQSDLTVTDAAPPVRKLAGRPGDGGRTRYAVEFAPGQRELTLRYRGRIQLPPEQLHSGFGRGQAASGGVIGPDGVYLEGASGWYPLFDDALLHYTLEVEMPAGWSAVSQGRRTVHVRDAAQARDRWEEAQPQEDIYLIAAPFREYRRGGEVDKLVLLREHEPALAERYLAVMDQYIELYSRLLGPYPYAKFALVENNWESGYGMPSFTLLGPRVIRLPFILHGSFPHEILHNWWGNGVYVGAGGNWAEGLTAYLADHLLQEQNGRGAAYRRDALLRYTNYVAAQADFPLTEFRARHSDASQAVGYDKALMVFHMLRLELGDERYVAALRRLYRDALFQRAGWDTLRAAFEREARTPLHAEFEQWLHRTDAPALRIAAAHATERDGSPALELALTQTQPGAAYRLRIPVAVTVAGADAAVARIVVMDDKQASVTLRLPARPLHVAVDPDFDVFRRLDPAELPPTLSEALAAERLLIVLPAAAPAALRDGYAQLAQRWAEGADGVRVSWDSELQGLPSDRAVWLFGWENRFGTEVGAALAGHAMHLDDGRAHIAGTDYPRAAHAVVLAARRGGHALVWLGSDNVAALPGLARKLPHYGSASYLAFRGDEPTNVLRGQWPVLDSPLAVAVAQPDGAPVPTAPAPHAPRPALTHLLVGR